MEATVIRLKIPLNARVIDSSIYSFIHPYVPQLIRPSMHSSTNSSIYSFIRSLNNISRCYKLLLIKHLLFSIHSELSWGLGDVTRRIPALSTVGDEARR